MDPQSNPINNTQGDDVPAGDASLPSGGSTFQPQDNPAGGTAMPMGNTGAMGATPPPTPGWQNEAAADAAEIYGAPANAAAPMPPNPLLGDTQPAATPPANAMNQDFSQASQMSAPTAPPAPSADPNAIPSSGNSAMPPNPLLGDTTTPAAASTEPMMPVAPTAAPMAEPAMQAPEPSMAPAAPEAPVAPTQAELANDMGGTPPPDVPGAMPESNQPPMPAEVPMPQADGGVNQASMMTPQQNQLPGSAQLGQAAAGMDQANPAMNNMGTYGPPPKKSKKALFIIIGAVIGVIIISIVVALLLSSRKQPAPTISTTQEQTQQNTVATPSSGPATPPAGYKTIEKQCYTFALITPNTVPTDQACTFKKSTFGGKGISTITVDTSTNSYKTIDEFLEVFKQDKTVDSSEDIKLDNLDAKQLIYKYSDGKTYTYIAALIVGKNYQQDGKPVTAVGITISDQDAFDQGVIQNVIDTWRWK